MENTIVRVYGFGKKKVWVDPDDIEMVKIDDHDPDTSWIGEFSDTPEEGAIPHPPGINNPRIYNYFNPATEYGDQDYERFMQIERGDVWFYGVRAQVTFLIPTQWANNFIIETLDSPGLWGVESDSGDDYFEEIFQEEKGQLIHVLESMGVKVGEPLEVKIQRVLAHIPAFFNSLVERRDREVREFSG